MPGGRPAAQSKAARANSLTSTRRRRSMDQWAPALPFLKREDQIAALWSCWARAAGSTPPFVAPRGTPAENRGLGARSPAPPCATVWPRPRMWVPPERVERDHGIGRLLVDGVAQRKHYAAFGGLDVVDPNIFQALCLDDTDAPICFDRPKVTFSSISIIACPSPRQSGGAPPPSLPRSSRIAVSIECQVR
jgi:hypothetical protein